MTRMMHRILLGGATVLACVAGAMQAAATTIAMSRAAVAIANGSLGLMP